VNWDLCLIRRSAPAAHLRKLPCVVASLAALQEGLIVPDRTSVSQALRHAIHFVRTRECLDEVSQSCKGTLPGPVSRACVESHGESLLHDPRPPHRTTPPQAAGYNLDVWARHPACQSKSCLFELNSSPGRLDVSAENVRLVGAMYSDSRSLSAAFYTFSARFPHSSLKNMCRRLNQRIFAPHWVTDRNRRCVPLAMRLANYREQACAYTQPDCGRLAIRKSWLPSGASYLPSNHPVESHRDLQQHRTNHEG
jgi:hypothetical protein